MLWAVAQPWPSLSVSLSGVPLHLLTENAPAAAAGAEAATAEEAAFPTASTPRLATKLKVRPIRLTTLSHGPFS